MQLFVINEDKDLIKKAISSIGKEAFDKAHAKKHFDKRRKLYHYRLKMTTDVLQMTLQIIYPSGIYDLCKIAYTADYKKGWSVVVHR